MHPPDETAVVFRHKTALKRKDLSRPAKCALRDGLIGVGTSVFDYGCGHGGDVALLGAQGIAAAGWDPKFIPDRPVEEADVVQLGYVINVIEDPASGPRPWPAAGGCAGGS
jgi:DNA phosphorothioation-associated putative methyltransferase